MFNLFPINDKTLINYMCKQLKKEKGLKFSDIRSILNRNYTNLSPEGLQEEKDRLSLRKEALENDDSGNFTNSCIACLAVFATATTIFFDVLPLQSIFLLSYLAIAATIFLFISHLRTTKRAKEIAYCALALDVIKKMKPELFN
ncbi:hypothetical protein [Desulfosporosinus youngiae]|uniref:hypothetical protein n=1 Tax=Desulfosporosinus youngiae TaxID=339862 RepID=UPI0012F48151|nr:hypothetical protein [Desulfosporosinus youngiae]